MSEILFLLIGLLIGAIIIWIKKDKKIVEIQESLSEKLDKEKEIRIKTEADLKALQSTQKNALENMQDSFTSLASKAMQHNNDSFIKLANQVMQKYLVETKSNVDKNKESLNNLINPLKDSLKNHENLVKNLQENNSKTYGSLKNHLEELAKQQKNLEKETSALVTALKSPKVRGRWGEIGLKRIVEFSGMSAYCDFTEQTSISTDDGRLRPDLIVNLPENKKIVIDSKVPLNAYLEALESDDDETRASKMTSHAKAVINHVKQLSSKAYWSQFDNTVDFVVLYIEVESAFGAALINNTNLITDAIQNRIVFATPTTLITLLQTVSYSWKQHQATENALKIWQSSTEIYERLAIFSDYFSKIGSGLNSAVKTYNQAIGSWENRIIPGIKKMENLGVGSEKKSLIELNELESNTREFNKDNK